MEHSPENPLVSVGRGTSSFAESLGSFLIDDSIEERLSLDAFEVEGTGETVTLSLFRGGEPAGERVRLVLSSEERDLGGIAALAFPLIATLTTLAGDTNRYSTSGRVDLDSVSRKHKSAKA